MYRPEGWDNPFIPSVTTPSGVIKYGFQHDAYEAGADAMLKAIVEWLSSQCENHPLVIHPVKKKIACRVCWQELQQGLT